METIPQMTVTVLDRALVVGDAGQVTGERQERPDPEVPEKARRRTFTAQYKLDVVAEYDAAATGEKGAVLRREGLYSSHVIEWRRARDAGTPGIGRRQAHPGPVHEPPTNFQWCALSQPASLIKVPSRTKRCGYWPTRAWICCASTGRPSRMR